MKHTTVCKFFLIAGLLFVLAGVYRYQVAADFAARAVEGSGIVVSLERTRGGSYRPVVEWTDHTGAIQTLYSPTSSSPPSFFKGEEVTVLFDPADPKYPLSARINSTLQVWGVAIFLGIFGFAWMLIASLTWYVHFKGGEIHFDATDPGRQSDRLSDLT